MGQVLNHAIYFLMIWAGISFLTAGAIMIVYVFIMSQIHKDVENAGEYIEKHGKIILIVAIIIGLVITYSADSMNML